MELLIFVSLFVVIALLGVAGISKVGNIFAHRSMTLEMNAEAADMINALVLKENKSRAEIIRRAIGLYSFLHGEIMEDPYGRRVAIIEKNGKVKESFRWW